MIHRSDLEAYEPFLIATRRHLHMHPECGFELPKTHDYVRDRLVEAGIVVQEHVGRNSLLGILENGPGPVIGLRADMDALPMDEANEGIAYRSTVLGRMHACGHDGHTAMLLTTARWLSDHRAAWSGTVKFIFQEAEEGPAPGGAEGVVASGLVDDVDVFYALHVTSAFPSGTIAIKPGEAMAAADTIEIRMKGRGGHAAYPHQCVDPVLMQAEVVNALQTIVARHLDPTHSGVVTIAQVHVGTTHNVIPDVAYLQGSVRTLNEADRGLMQRKIGEVAEAVAAMHGGSFEYRYERGYDPTINGLQAFASMKEATTAVLGAECFLELTAPTMGAEDFSKYILKKTGCIGWLGTRNDDSTSFGMHHPRFNLDESALLSGVALFVGLVVKGN